MLVPSRKASELLGICAKTLRKYADRGDIRAVRGPSGQRLYDTSSFFGNTAKSAVVCYCRVSSYKQQDDLARQVEFMRAEYPDSEIIQDIGSGLNFKRKGLRALLGRVLQGEKLSLVVSHRDRLARFATDLISWLLEQNGGRLVVLNKSEHSPAEELTRDLLSIIHVFSCRVHGLRRYRLEMQEDQDLP